MAEIKGEGIINTMDDGTINVVNGNGILFESINEGTEEIIPAAVYKGEAGKSYTVKSTKGSEEIESTVTIDGESETPTTKPEETPPVEQPDPDEEENKPSEPVEEPNVDDEE